MITKIDVDRQFLFEPNPYALIRAEIHGELSIEALISSIENTILKYEILNCKILEDTLGNFYYCKNDSPQRPYIIIENRIQTTQDLIHMREKQNFDLKNGDLIHFIIQKEENRLVLNLFFHHLLGDGKSILMLLEDILLNTEKAQKIYSATEYDSFKIPLKVLSKETLLALYPELPESLPYANTLNKEWRKSPVIPTFKEQQELFQTYWNHTKTFLSTETLPENTVTHFHSLCKQNNISINSALTTLFIKQLRTAPYFTMAINLRAKKDSSFGNYSMGTQLSLHYNPNQSFFENAQQIHKLLKEKIQDKKRLMEEILFCTYFDNSLFSSAYLQKEHMLENKIVNKFINNTNILKNQVSLCISNLGKNDIQEIYHTFKIHELSIVSPLTLQLDCNLCIITANSQMTLNMIYRKNNIDYAKMLSDVTEQIQQLASGKSID